MAPLFPSRSLWVVPLLLAGVVVGACAPGARRTADSAVDADPACRGDGACIAACARLRRDGTSAALARVGACNEHKLRVSMSRGRPGAGAGEATDGQDAGTARVDPVAPTEERRLAPASTGPADADEAGPSGPGAAAPRGWADDGGGADDGGWADAPRTSVAAVVERVRPSVVTIRHVSGLGSGFVVRRDGWIATNVHVAAGGATLSVETSTGKRHPVVAVMGYDIRQDVAVLKIDAELPALPVVSAARLPVGSRVLAIGSPLGLSLTVSDGLFSGVRETSSGRRLMQVSAPISPGSSGGPVLDSRGRVVAIATGTLRSGQNLNFAVPSDVLRAVLGRAQRTTLGRFRQDVEALRSR